MRAEESRAELTSNVNQLLESSRDVCQRLMGLEDAFDAGSMISKRRTVCLKLSHSRDDDTKSFLSRINAVEHDNASSSPASPATLPDSERSPTSSFGFEPALEASRVYRRAQRETMDFSFRSSVAWSNRLSIFSGLTFGDLSVMSVIVLPICAAEISNAHHYAFGNRESDTTPAPAAAIATEHSPIVTVNSLLYDCLEIAD